MCGHDKTKLDPCNRDDPRNANFFNFMDAHRPDAQALASQLRVPVEFILGVSAAESAYGGSNIAQNAHNFFGLHAPKTSRLVGFEHRRLAAL